MNILGSVQRLLMSAQSELTDRTWVAEAAAGSPPVTIMGGGIRVGRVRYARCAVWVGWFDPHFCFALLALGGDTRASATPDGAPFVRAQHPASRQDQGVRSFFCGNKSKL